MQFFAELKKYIQDEINIVKETYLRFYWINEWIMAVIIQKKIVSSIFNYNIEKLWVINWGNWQTFFYLNITQK